MRIKNYINGIEGVSSGGTANARVPVNKRYHSLIFFATATGETLIENIISNIRIFVNSVVMVDLKPAEIQAIARMNGLTVDDLSAPYYFSEPWRASITGEEATSWDLFNQDTCTIEVQFQTGLTAPTLKILAEFDYGRNTTIIDGKPQTFLSIVKRTANTYNAGSGINDITTLPQDWPIQRLLIDASAGTIDLAEVYRDDEKVYEATPSQNEQALEAKGMDATEFTYPIVFDSDQQMSSAMSVKETLLVRLTNSAAGTNRIITERRANGYI